MRTHDVVVVGARCAGAPLATMLAQRGLDVCLVDRARFPSDTPSTHGIQPAGVAVLERLGLRERLLELTDPIDDVVMITDDVRAPFPSVRAVAGRPMLSIRRITLDAVLVERACRAGVTLRQGTPVTGLRHEGGRVVGVTTRDGEIRGRLVVGADGARSTVARLVGAPEYATTAGARVFVWGYFTGVADGVARIGKLGDRGYLCMPTDAGLYLAAVAPTAERWQELGRDREAAFAEGVRAWPELEGLLAGAERDGPLHVFSGWHGFFRRSSGPGWALVGDAGHFKDPSPGQGISDALRQAERLAEAIAGAAAAGPAAMDAATRTWWRWRDDDAWEMYWFAYDLGVAGPTPLLLREGQRRLAADQARMRGLMHVLNHDVPPSKLLTPAFGLASTVAALRHHPRHRREILATAASTAREEMRRARARRQCAATVAPSGAIGRPSAAQSTMPPAMDHAS